MDVEKFAWLESVSPWGETLVLASGNGFVTVQDDPRAHATVRELLADPARGSLMSATALIAVRAGTEVRYPMLLRDAAAAVSPNRWQWPAGRCAPGELPLTTACRELCEELGLEGAAWDRVRIWVGGAEVTYLTTDAIQSFRARYALHGNTVEFFYPMELEVASFAEVRFYDREPYNRQVALFTEAEVLALLKEGRLADGSEAVVKSFFLP